MQADALIDLAHTAARHHIMPDLTRHMAGYGSTDLLGGEHKLVLAAAQHASALRLALAGLDAYPAYYVRRTTLGGRSGGRSGAEAS